MSNWSQQKKLYLSCSVQVTASCSKSMELVCKISKLYLLCSSSFVGLLDYSSIMEKEDTIAARLLEKLK